MFSLQFMIKKKNKQGKDKKEHMENICTCIS